MVVKMPDSQKKQTFSRMRWTLKIAKTEAKKYSSRTEFIKGSHGAYSWARRHNILNQICGHMAGSSALWDTSEVLSEAMNYDSRSKFFLHCKSGYEYCIQKNILDLTCRHMHRKS
jgi:hypothetical protein